jgi:hypothetical protein
MTGFTTSAFLSRNRVSPKEAFEGLELCERKLSRTVLRGLDGSNPVRLLGQPPAISQFSKTGLLGSAGFYLVDKRDERYAPIVGHGPRDEA